MLLKTVSKIFGLLGYICLSSACVADEVSDMCIKNLPNRLGLEKNAPETMRFVGDETDIIDYESQKGGQGWGYAPIRKVVWFFIGSLVETYSGVTIWMSLS